MSDSTNTKPEGRKHRLWLYLLLGLAGLWGAVVLIGFVVFATLFGGNDLTLDDFDSQDEARFFVSDHLPVGLPPEAQVKSLRYSKFTDWILEAEIQFPSSGASSAFIEQVAAARQTDEYCGPAAEGTYFLAQYQACGSLSTGSSDDVLRLVCNTR